MTDPILASAAARGLPFTCRRGLHKFQLVTAAVINGKYERTERCRRCGRVRTERGDALR